MRLSVVKDLGLLLHQEGPQFEQTRAQAQEILTKLSRRDAEPVVRGLATVTLADHPSEGALDALLVAARDEHSYVVEMALLGLRDVAPRGHREATRVVEQRFKDERAALRFQATLAAGRVLADEAFVPLTLAALTDADAKVRYVACRTCDERFSDALPPELEGALTRALDDADAQVPVAAAFVLAPRGNTLARTVLSRAINARVRLPARRTSKPWSS